MKKILRQITFRCHEMRNPMALLKLDFERIVDVTFSKLFSLSRWFPLDFCLLRRNFYGILFLKLF